MAFAVNTNREYKDMSTTESAVAAALPPLQVNPKPGQAVQISITQNGITFTLALTLSINAQGLLSFSADQGMTADSTTPV